VRVWLIIGCVLSPFLTAHTVGRPGNRVKTLACDCPAALLARTKGAVVDSIERSVDLQKLLMVDSACVECDPLIMDQSWLVIQSHWSGA